MSQHRVSRDQFFFTCWGQCICSACLHSYIQICNKDNNRGSCNVPQAIQSCCRGSLIQLSYQTSSPLQRKSVHCFINWTNSIQIRQKSEKVKGVYSIALDRKPVSELQSVTCYMGSHSANCHPTMQPPLTPARQVDTDFFVTHGAV